MKFELQGKHTGISGKHMHILCPVNACSDIRFANIRYCRLTKHSFRYAAAMWWNKPAF